MPKGRKAPLNRAALYPHLNERVRMGPVSNKPYSRIVGGEEATPHEFPWACALYIDSYFCTGSLICKITNSLKPIGETNLTLALSPLSQKSFIKRGRGANSHCCSHPLIHIYIPPH